MIFPVRVSSGKQAQHEERDIAKPDKCAIITATVIEGKSQRMLPNGCTEFNFEVQMSQHVTGKGDRLHCD